MNIAIVGAGYVGFANALVLSRCHVVTVVDTNEQKVKLIEQHELNLGEKAIESYLLKENLQLAASSDLAAAARGANWVMIATPTDYDPVSGVFDTSSVKSSVDAVVTSNPDVKIVIKSTVPVGFSKSISSQYPTTAILFAPEFLREGRALDDCLNPSRIVVGGDLSSAAEFAALYAAACDKKSVPILLTGFQEAEAIKLFANTYLAMRVAYFNEIDTFALSEGLDVEAIISGICMDPRIGSHYNNPSFGYGGYCLPKDTKQLLANYADIPQNLISAVVRANDTRQRFISNDILSRHPNVVGVYRLAMKSGSDNFRASSILRVVELLRDADVTVVVFEPGATELAAPGCELISDLAEFKTVSDVIIANRKTAELDDVGEKLYTRDLYGRD